MEEGNSKKIIIIAIAVIAVIVILFLVINRKPSISYSTGQCTEGHDEILISSKDELDKFVTKVKMSENIETNKFKKVTINDIYNDEFFKDKKLEAIVLYVDDSKEYIHAIEGVTYSQDKKTATINYTYKSGNYLGTLGKTWYTVLLVELDNNVETVNCVNVGK